MMANNSPGSSLTSDQATENNQRLFRRYARVFQSSADSNAFSLHAQKLSVWLNDYKAYYVAARPEIVKLLLIAQGTLRRVLNITPELNVPFNIYDHPPNPFSASYEVLVNTVFPYLHMFYEPGLAAHIEALRKTIINPRSTHSGTRSSPHANFAAPAQTANNVSVSLEHMPAPQETARLTSPSVMLNQDPDIPMIDSSNFLPLPSTKPEVPPTSVISTSSKDPKSLAPTKRSKKRKTLDLDALAQTDIQGLMAQQESNAQTSKEAFKEDTPAPRNGITSEAASPIIVHREDTAEHQLTTEETSKTSVIGPTGSEDNQQMDVVIENTIMPQSEPDIQITPSENILEENAFKQQHTAEETNQVPDSEVDMPQDTEQMVVDMTPPTTTIPETPIADQPPELMAMDVDESLELTQSHVENQQSADSAHMINYQEVENPMPVMLTEPESPVEADGSIFTSDMRVIAAEKGRREASYIHMQFDIPEIDFLLLDRWAKRTESLSVEEIQSSICASVGCYLAAELSKHSEENTCETLEKSLARCQSTWPDSSSLVLNVEFEGQQQALPLAPPLLVTSNNLVDISKYVTVGTNIFELLQYEDMSQYIFVLHTHHPTRTQIQQLKQQRRNDKEWQDWIQHICRPLPPPAIPSE